MNILDKIKNSCKEVAKNSIYVKINTKRLDEIIELLDINKMKFWLDSNPFDLLSLSTKDLINYLLILHTIGDFCFWGEPKWEIETEHGKLDGSYAMMYIILKNYDKFQKKDISFEEFKNLLKGSAEIPLLKKRYENLKTMNIFLKECNTEFYDLIENFYDDKSLFQYIITWFPYFKDESIYKGTKVYFYKRAQLLTSDILHIRKKLENKEVDYTSLVGCADYKIPQVMRCYGILEFNEELANIVDKKIPLTPDSEMEIEIRANEIVVIDYIAMELKNKITRMNINDYIWALGQNKEMMTKPYHRVLTDKY